MVVDIKKSVPMDFMMPNTSKILEILIYYHYLLKIKGTSTVLSVLTDGANWHCLSLECCRNDDRRVDRESFNKIRPHAQNHQRYIKTSVTHISKYSHFTSTLSLKFIGTIPKVLQ